MSEPVALQGPGENPTVSPCELDCQLNTDCKFADWIGASRGTGSVRDGIGRAYPG